MANSFVFIPDDESKEAASFRETGVPTPDPANEAPAGGFVFTPDDDPDYEPYDWTVAGAPLPAALQPAGDIIAAANSKLAGILGAPVDLVDAAMKQAGLDGIFDNPGGAKDAIISAFEKVGIGADRKKIENEFFGDVGDAVGENLLMLSAFMAAAPTMLAKQGSGAMSELVRQLGSGIVRYPGTAVAAEMTAGLGGEGGAAAGSNFGPMGEAIGGMIGSMAGAAAPYTGVGTVVSATGNAINAAKNVGRAAQIGREGAAMGPVLRDSAPQVDLIADAVRGDQMRVDNIIERLTAKMTQGADPLESAEALQAVQRAAYPQARKIEGDYWGKVDLKRTLPSAGLKMFRDQMIRATAKEGRSEWLPGDLLAKIKALPPKASMQSLRAIRTLAFDRLQSGTVPTQQGTMPVSDTLRRNLNSLVREIDNQIETAFPNDVALKQATSFTRWLHGKFTRGPVAQFARPRANEETLPDIEAAARQALRQKKFGPATADIADELEMPAMRTAAEQFVRGQLEAEVQRMGPEAAQKFVKQPSVRSFLRSYPEVAAEWQATGQRLQRMTQFRKEVMNSAFVKEAGEHPEQAIRKIITQRSPKNAALLMKRISKNPEAVDAAKNQTILELEAMAQGDPSKILTILGSRDTRNAVGRVLGNDLDRLERIAREAANLMQVDQNGTARYLVRRGARVMGAWLGRKLNTGTLQAPEFGGRLSQKLVDDWLGSTENDIFSKAVRYPAWEAVLKARLPQSNSEVRRLKTLVRRAIRIEEATEQASAPLQSILLGENEE